MPEVDIETVKYKFGRLAHEYDSQTFIAEIEEHYGGELYGIGFQRGYSTYILEIEGERLADWLSCEKPPHDMIEAVKLAVEELTS